MGKITTIEAYTILLKYKDLLGDEIYNTGIYKLTFKERPEYFYVGCASGTRKYNCYKGFYSRWKRHLYDFTINAHKNTFLQNMYDTYDSISFEILEVCPAELVFIREKEWFDKLKPLTNFQGNKKHKTYECLPEGIKKRRKRKTFKHSEQTKLKMSLASPRISNKKVLPDDMVTLIIEEIKSGKTFAQIKAETTIGYVVLYWNLLRHITESELVELKLKSVENGYLKKKTDMSTRQVKHTKKYSHIVPSILDLYRSGKLIKEIVQHVGIHDDLIARLIRENMNKYELTTIQNRNMKRK